MPNSIDYPRELLEVSQKLIQFFGVMGLQIPSNFDKIVTFCYDDIYKQVEFDYTGLKDWDIYRTALSRWIENKTTIENTNYVSSNKYFDLSKLRFIIDTPTKLITVRKLGIYKHKSFYLNSLYSWVIKKDNSGTSCLIPLDKNNSCINLSILSTQTRIFDNESCIKAGFLSNLFLQVRAQGLYNNEAFYLNSYKIKWEIKKDNYNILCLIPTKI